MALWNEAEQDAATAALIHCCTAHRWAQALTAERPFLNEESLYTAADTHWAAMREPDWMEAFRAHPRIGERKAGIGERKAETKPVEASAQSKAWSTQEQAQVQAAELAILAALAEGNRAYEERFGFTYIVCATEKSAEEMLAILNRRLANDRTTELREAAEQQRQITQIRLRKWLES